MKRPPTLVPCTIPFEKGIQLKKIADMISRYPEILHDQKDIISRIFEAMDVFNPENDAEVGVTLKRIGKELERGELRTTLPNGAEIDIFHTCLESDEPRPYSFAEVATLKAKCMIYRIRDAFI